MTPNARAQPLRGTLLPARWFRRVARAAGVAAMLSVFALGASDAPAQQAGNGGTGAPLPLTRLDVTLSADTGAVTIRATVEAPQGTVRPPAAPWLSVTKLRVGESFAPPGPVAPARHGGATIALTYSGTLPAMDARLGSGFDGEAAFLTGPAWLPLDDAAARRFTVTGAAGNGWIMAGTGSVNGTDAATVTLTGRPDALAVFFGPYTVSRQSHDGLTLRTYFEADDTDLSGAYLDATARHLDRYRAILGGYPYGGFSVVSATLPVGLGFAGLTYVSRDILGHPYMLGRSLAHEVLHTWWGGAVGIDYATGNWAEGLTTYMADHALAAEADPDAARAMRVGWARELAAIPPGSARPLTAFRSAAEAAGQGEGYGKAAMVFHMLRARIGADAFDAGAARLYAAHSGGVAGWDDLRAAFEAASGTDLSDFFAQWLTRPGVPEIALHDARLGRDGQTLVLNLRQSEPVYDLRVPVGIETAAGTETRVLALRTDRARYRLAFDAPVTGVRVDPGFDIARAPAAGELAPILADLLRAGPLAAIPAEAGPALRDAIADALGPRLSLDWQAEETAPRGDGALLVAGTPDAVADARARLVPDSAVAPPEAGTTRLWVERDAAGRLVGFLATPDADTAARDLARLGFYLGAGAVALEAGRAVATESWPDPGTPLRARF